LPCACVALCAGVRHAYADDALVGQCVPSTRSRRPLAPARARRARTIVSRLRQGRPSARVPRAFSRPPVSPPLPLARVQAAHRRTALVWLLIGSSSRLFLSMQQLSGWERLHGRRLLAYVSSREKMNHRPHLTGWDVGAQCARLVPSRRPLARPRARRARATATALPAPRRARATQTFSPPTAWPRARRAPVRCGPCMCSLSLSLLSLTLWRWVRP
jgi:hypothetical protein